MIRLNSRYIIDLSALCMAACTLLACLLPIAPAFADTRDSPADLIMRCDQGMAIACLEMGQKDTDAIGTPINLARGLTYFEKGCDLGNAKACALAAAGHYNAHGTPIRDLMKAISYGNKACEGGDADGCLGLARVYRNATGMPDHAALAATMAAKACTLGSGSGCAPTSPTTIAAASSPQSPAPFNWAARRGASTEVPSQSLGAAALATTAPRGIRGICNLNTGVGCRTTTSPRVGPAAAPAQQAPVQSNACSTLPHNTTAYFDCLANRQYAPLESTYSRPIMAQGSPSDATVAATTSGSTRGFAVCTTTSGDRRSFNHTNPFEGVASQTSVYERHYKSMNEMMNQRAFAAFPGQPSSSSGVEGTSSCSWYPSRSEAMGFIDSALANARRNQMSTSQTMFTFR